MRRLTCYHVAKLSTAIPPNRRCLRRCPFLDITDAVPGKYFDAATTAPDPLNPNRLIFGFHTGLDLQMWISRTFTASTAAFYRASAMDTIRFLVAAPPGYYIAAISYTQRGIGTMARTSKATGGATWLVDDIAEDLGR